MLFTCLRSRVKEEVVVFGKQSFPVGDEDLLDVILPTEFVVHFFLD